MKLYTQYPSLTVCAGEIEAMIRILNSSFETGHRLYVCGNGGSAADSLHIVGELVKSFSLKRELDKSFIGSITDNEMLENLQGALPAFALTENTAFSTAFANDCNPVYVFAQQVYAYARKGDCVLGISTSGLSKNVVQALVAAKGRGATALGLTGASGGKMKEICDCCICVPETETHRVQELHLPVYHAICLEVERYFWGY